MSTPPSVYARRRMVAGILLGVMVQLVLAIILGLMLSGSSSISGRLTVTAISSMVATPLLTGVGFAIMLKDAARPFGGGIVIGALLSTLLVLGGCAVGT